MRVPRDCGHCALYGSRELRCMLSNKQTKRDFICESFTVELYRCDVCGQPMLPTALVIDEVTSKLLCRNCAKTLDTCNTCQRGNICEFETNPDPTPKVIMQTVRQGPMTMQTQVRNPERVQRYCTTCDCYDAENGCLKMDGGWCSKCSCLV